MKRKIENLLTDFRFSTVWEVCKDRVTGHNPVSVLYGQAQSLAFSQAQHDPQITRPLISAAEAQATQIIRDNFVQPTLNALGYNLTGFTIHWSAAS